MIRITPVESTTLFTVGYDYAAQLLRLQFHSRAVYYYSGVTADIYQTLLTAPSKGAYFNRNIRGRFPFQKALDLQTATPTPHAAR
jgi:KTSC domain